MGRLHVVKGIINRIVVKMLKVVPRVRARRPVSTLTRRLFLMLNQATLLHPTRFYADGNFPRILDAAERTLVFIAEQDGHYAGWLAEAMLLIHDLVEEERMKFPPGEAGDVAFYTWAAQHGTSKVGSKQARRT